MTRSEIIKRIKKDQQATKDYLIEQELKLSQEAR
jgi:hypothetical protein